MRKPKSHHVVSNPKGGWDVKKSGSSRASKHTENKQDAVDAGRNISKNQKTELFIRKMNAKIQKPYSHGNDPLLPKS